MIQYKLIKEYPESPILGTIHWFECDEFSNKSSRVWKGTLFYDTNPEFWQKVEALDYNKPLLSLNDILNAWETNEYLQNREDYKQSPLFNNFKKAAEAKQNLQEYINNIETLCTEVKYSIKK